MAWILHKEVEHIISTWDFYMRPFILQTQPRVFLHQKREKERQKKMWWNTTVPITQLCLKLAKKRRRKRYPCKNREKSVRGKGKLQKNAVDRREGNMVPWKSGKNTPNWKEKIPLSRTILTTLKVFHGLSTSISLRQTSP